MANVTQAEYDAYMAAKPEKQANESNTAYNQRVTQWYKDQPHNPLTAAQADAGATLQWVRTGAGGEGEYKVVYPIGVQFDKTTGAPIIDPNTGKAVNAFNPSTPAGASNAGGKTVKSSTQDAYGNTVITYTDGTTKTVPAGSDSAALVLGGGNTPATVDTAAQAERQSAYDLLFSEFNKYGLGSLVEPLKGMITNAQVSPSEFSIALQNTDAYKQRFAANQDRIAKGLQALTPAQYIGLEDQYQNIMRNYGLPASYYQKTDALGTQAGLNKLIANDVSATELEDRIATAQQRVINADPNVTNALKQFYPNITSGDILAYTLDPTNALNDIKRKVTAAEIGGAALDQGLMTSQAAAEDLAKYGITKAQAQQGYTNIAEFLPTATTLGDIYNKQGLGPYNQATAEAEVFNTADAAAAAQKRKKLSALEQAQFSGSSGTSNNALNRDRAMTNQMLGIPGAGQF